MSYVTALPAEAARPADPWAPGRFEIGYLTPERTVRGAALEEAWPVPSEYGLPVRRFALPPTVTSAPGTATGSGHPMPGSLQLRQRLGIAEP